ncbi:MAG: MATE family efflux transporter, partial [Acidobacteriota bacterium]
GPLADEGETEGAALAARGPVRIDTGYRRILRVTSPVLVTQLSYTAMGVIDTMMVGQLGVVELGAVGLGNLLSWWFLSLFFGMLAGVNTFVAQSYGAEDGDGVAATLWHGLYMGLGMLAIIACVWPFAPSIFALTGADAEMIALAGSYSQVRLGGALGLVILGVSDNFYRGLGRTDVPMFCAFGQLTLNCGINYLLIFGKFGFPQLGAVGAAWGTVIAQLIIGLTLLSTILLGRLRSEYRLFAHLRFRPAFALSMLRVSAPIGVQVFMEMGGISVFSAVVARLGTVEMAVTNAVIQAWSLAFMSAYALSVGATTLTGQCLGAGQKDEVRLVVRRVMFVGLGLMTLTGTLYIGFPEQIIEVFGKEGELSGMISYARPLLTVVVVCLFFDLRLNVLAGALRGAGDTTYAMVVTIASAWLIFVPLTLYTTPRWGLLAAWWCLVLHVAVMTLLLEVRYRGQKWLRRLATEEVLEGEPLAPQLKEEPVG